MVSKNKRAQIVGNGILVVRYHGTTGGDKCVKQYDEMRKGKGKMEREIERGRGEEYQLVLSLHHYSQR